MRLKCNPSPAQIFKTAVATLLVAVTATLFTPAGHAQVRHRGIDVSRYQGTIDWKKVAKDSTIQFVYIKASEGATWRDPNYSDNILRARQAGLLVGSYHVYSSSSSAQQQMANMKKVVKKRQQDIIPVLDIEANQAGRLNLDRVDKLLSLMEKEYGVRPMIYTSEKLFLTHFNVKRYSKYHMFIANYRQIPSTRYTLWQYTQTGRCSGIDGHVDFSRFRRGCTLSTIKMPKSQKDSTLAKDSNATMEAPFVRGVDVSKYQGSIDWKVVAKDTTIQFAYIKATEGSTHTDPNYSTNIFHARRAGLLVGSYHIYSNSSSAVLQMDHIRKVIVQRQQDLLPVLDIQGNLIGRLDMARVEKLLSLMEQEYGGKPIIYTSEALYKKHFADKRYATYHFFLANYKERPMSRFTLWQYSNSGTCKGIKGKVDLVRLDEKRSLDELKMPHTKKQIADAGKQVRDRCRGLEAAKRHGNIDWTAVAADTTFKFAYIKATEGASGVDANYSENIFRARRAGLLVGAYHLYTNQSSAQKQLENIRKVVKHRQIDLVPAVRIDDKLAGKVDMARLNKLLSLMEKEFGSKPALYISEKVYKAHFTDKRYDTYHLILVNLQGSPSVRYTLWQFTQEGQASGIGGKADFLRLHAKHTLGELKLPKQNPQSTK